MAQATYTPISLYHSTTAAAVPTSANLVAGELALNTVDEKLYFKNSAGTVKLLASNATSAPVLTFSAGTTGFTPSSATSGAVTLAGTLATTNGGTGLTAFTANQVFYASSTSAFAQSANLTFNGTTLTANTIGAFTLSGTIAGGGNQINNVIIGTSTPLAGAFTTVTASTPIGTTSGGTGLTSFTSGGVVYASSTSALATGSALTWNGSNLGVTGTLGISGTITSTQVGLLFEKTGASTSSQYIAIANTSGQLYFGTNGTGPNAFFTNGTAYDTSLGVTGGFAIGMNGGAQIGRFSSSGLEVTQSQLIGYSSYAGIGTNGLAVAGNVGIGTSSPVAKNHIRGSGTSGQVTSSFILENASSGAAGMDITGSAGASRWRFLYTGAGPSTGTNTFSESMCILTEGTRAGNVGIGTIEPMSKLNIDIGNISGTLGQANQSNILLGNAGASAGNLVQMLFGYVTSAVTYAPAAIGFVSTSAAGNTKGDLVFGTRDVTTDTAPSERVRITSAGNVGIGVTPSAWYSNVKAFQIGNGLSLWSSANTNAVLSQNLYLDATATYRWITANPATNFNQSNGAFSWTLAAGTPSAGGAIGSFTTYMTLDASGNLGVGTTSPLGKIDSSYNITTFEGGQFVASNVAKTNYASITAVNGQTYSVIQTFNSSVAAGALSLQPSAGNVGIGTNLPSQKLSVAGTILATTTSTPAIIARSTSTGMKVFYDDGRTEFTAVNYDGLATVGAQDLYLVSGQKATFGVNSNSSIIYPLEITTAGVLSIPYGQIKFPATQNASSDANTLDDYEEGTYNVTMTPSTSGSITSQTGFTSMSYTKVGRVVTIVGNPRIQSVSSPTGSILLTLPFPVRNGTATTSRAGSSITYYDNSNAPFYFFSIPCAAGETSTTLYIYVSSFSPAAVVPAADDELYVSYTYFTD